MNIADAILARLALEGIDTAFLVYGGAISELCDAFTRQDKIQYVCFMHEQSCGFAAEGYAKTKGISGLAIATSGPGGMNLVTAIGNCFFDSTPCIFITGQVATNLIKPDGSGLRQLGFQECDIVGICKPITKFAFTIKDATKALDTLDMAIDIAKSGRPGPVLLDIPVDVQRASC